MFAPNTAMTLTGVFGLLFATCALRIYTMWPELQAGCQASRMLYIPFFCEIGSLSGTVLYWSALGTGGLTLLGLLTIFDSIRRAMRAP